MSELVNFESTTPKLGLPRLFAGQGQKEFFVNEALSLLDGLVHLSVEGSVKSPPITPIVGECWIIGVNATGEWSGLDTKLALVGEGGWIIVEPSVGMKAFDKSLMQYQVFDGTWQYAPEPVVPQSGTTIDVEARAAIAELVAALRTFGAFSRL